MKLSFLNQPQPVLTAIMAGQTPEELVAESRNAEADGARGIAIDLQDFKPEFRNVEGFKRIVDAVNLPFMFYFYRNDRWGKPTDEERQEVLLAAAEAGASMIDVMGDLYDPSPREITRDPKAIDRQRKLIDTIHGKGADVVISSHVGCAMNTEEVLEHMQTLGQRGGDVVKIVTTTNTEDELAEAFRTPLHLHRELKTPFIHLCTGAYSRPHRFLGPALGVSIFFAVARFEPRYGLPQPRVSNMKAVLDNLRWNIRELP